MEESGMRMWEEEGDEESGRQRSGGGRENLEREGSRGRM